MNESLPKAKRRRLTRDNLSEKYSDTEIRIAQRRQRQILQQYKNKRKQISNTSIVNNKRKRKRDLKLQENTMKKQRSNHSKRRSRPISMAPEAQYLTGSNILIGFNFTRFTNH